MKDKLTTTQMKVEIIQFIKNAFCINGSVKIIYEHIEADYYIECNDKKRGIIQQVVSQRKLNCDKKGYLNLIKRSRQNGCEWDSYT